MEFQTQAIAEEEQPAAGKTLHDEKLNIKGQHFDGQRDDLDLMQHQKPMARNTDKDANLLAITQQFIL